MKTLTGKSRKVKILQLTVIITLIAIMAVFAASCKWTIGVVRGSGDLVTEERDVSGFDELHFSGMGSLIIEQGDEESLIIEADDNIIDLIETDVRGGDLDIKFRRGFNVVPTAKMKFYLTVIDLDRIDPGNMEVNERICQVCSFPEVAVADGAYAPLLYPRIHRRSKHRLGRRSLRPRRDETATARWGFTER